VEEVVDLNGPVALRRQEKPNLQRLKQVNRRPVNLKEVNTKQVNLKKLNPKKLNPKKVFPKRPVCAV
jgi:hypothetical protein